jgi:hypothetical protein
VARAICSRKGRAPRLDPGNDLLRQYNCAKTSASRQEKAPDDAGAFA